MKLTEQILDEMTKFDLSYHTRGLAESARMLQFYSSELDRLGEECPDVNVAVTGHSIILHRPEREQMLKFLLIFGGEWKKEVNDYNKDRMDYVQEIPHPLRDQTQDTIRDEENEGQMVENKFQRKFSFIVSQVEPPPSCKIVEEEVDVPARKEMRKRIVCNEEEKVEVTV